MQLLKIWEIKAHGMIALMLAAGLTLSACSVNLKKGDRDQDGNLDIKTPVGDLHVGKDADPHVTGLPVYPGARKKDKKDDSEDDGANLNIATSFFAVKVGAVEYTSDDPPAKVAEFYRDQLKKKFGNVIECRTSKHGGDLHVHPNKEDQQPDQVKCEENSGDNIELKVGTSDNQHIVEIEPKDKGTDFALVFVQTRGKQGSI